MFTRHVTKDLSAFCNGELSSEDSERVAKHLLGCVRCRAEFEEIKLGVSLAARLQRISAPESIWSEMEALLDKQSRNGSLLSKYPRLAPAILRPRFIALAAMLIIAIVIPVFLYFNHSSKASWEVSSLEGAPVVGSHRVSQTGTLAVGEWLETDGASRAKINVGEIGHVEVEPNTRIRLVETGLTEHRLALERGTMHATIFAPPRLFFVETPSAVAVDLGCAYTLEVDDRGRSILHVTFGWVALQLKDRESIVPAGALCETRKGIGPGTPYFEDASEMFKQSLTELDFEKNSAEALDLVLAESRERDTLTLWHLLKRLGETERGRVYDRLAALVAPPAGVTREGVLRLDKKMLDDWRSKLEPAWLD